MIEPIIIDIYNIREKRQQQNNELAYKEIKSKSLGKNVNKEEYKRVLRELKEIGKTENYLLEECHSNSMIARILAGRIAINASRQGIKDEGLQIDVCNKISCCYGIYIENLLPTAFRPTKLGNIITEKEMKKMKISKNECLKSFDAKISGKVNGWIFAKIVIGNGGHQDNVFEEAYSLCDWIIKFDKQELYILIIDTNLTSALEKLKLKYIDCKNIIIGNHIEVQLYFINNYSCNK